MVTEGERVSNILKNKLQEKRKTPMHVDSKIK